MSETPLFSFSVFTYNRALLLSQLLDQLIVVKNAFPPGTVEVIVCDNASTDGTPDLVRERYTAHGFRLVVQEKNVGATRNWLRAVQEARGIYVWPYADDDLLDIGAVVEIIVNHLSHGTSDFYHVNYIQGIYTETPRTAASLDQLHHAVDCDIIFPDIGSLVPYCGIMTRGIVVMGNIFKTEFVRGNDYKDCYEPDDLMDQVEVMLRAFKQRKSALLHQCAMLHLHPPIPRWFDEIDKPVPGSYVWTIGLMRRMARMVSKGVIAQSLIEEDGFMTTAKHGNSYLTFRRKLPHVAFIETLNFLKLIKRPLEAKDCEAIGAFAGYLADPEMQKLFARLYKCAETNDQTLIAQMDQLRGAVEQSGKVVMWQAAACPAYDRYVGKRVAITGLGATELSAAIVLRSDRAQA